MSISPILEIGIVVGRMLVGFTLAVAGLLKIKAGFPWFLKTLLAYDLIHGATAVVLSKGLPWLEVMCGSLLIVGFLIPVVVPIGFIILLVFILAIASAILRDKSVNCGCFGRSTKVSRARWTLIYRNIALMGLLLLVYTFGGGGLSADVWLNVHPFSAEPDALVQTWLIAIWIISLSMAVGLQVLTRKRLVGSGNKAVSEQSQ
jgi:putative oxidoreductase